MHLQLTRRLGLQFADCRRTRSPDRTVVSAQRGASSVVDATYLGVSFNATPMGWARISSMCSPGAGEELVGPPAEQKRIGALVGLGDECPGLVVARPHRPSAALESVPAVLFRRAAVSLHHSIDGDLRHGRQFHHRGSFSRWRPSRAAFHPCYERPLPRSDTPRKFSFGGAPVLIAIATLPVVGAPASAAGAGPRSNSSPRGRRVTQVPAGVIASSTLAGVSSVSTDVTTVVSLDALANNTVFSTVSGRLIGAADYGAQAKFFANGATQLYLERSGTTLVGGTLPGISTTAGSKLTIRVQVQGSAPTTIRAKAWPTGTTEPAAWRYTITDSTAGLQAAGAVRLTTYLSSSATSGPVNVRWDDLAVTAIG